MGFLSKYARIASSCGPAVFNFALFRSYLCKLKLLWGKDETHESISVRQMGKSARYCYCDLPGEGGRGGGKVSCVSFLPKWKWSDSWFHQAFLRQSFSSSLSGRHLQLTALPVRGEFTPHTPGVRPPLGGTWGETSARMLQLENDFSPPADGQQNHRFLRPGDNWIR